MRYIETFKKEQNGIKTILVMLFDRVSLGFCHGNFKWQFYYRKQDDMHWFHLFGGFFGFGFHLPQKELPTEKKL